MTEKKRIVVVGGGFGGLNLIKHVDKDKYDILLLDRNNYHSFPPLFYQILFPNALFFLGKIGQFSFYFHFLF